MILATWVVDVAAGAVQSPPGRDRAERGGPAHRLGGGVGPGNDGRELPGRAARHGRLGGRDGDHGDRRGADGGAPRGTSARRGVGRRVVDVHLLHLHADVVAGRFGADEDPATPGPHAVDVRGRDRRDAVEIARDRRSLDRHLQQGRAPGGRHDRVAPERVHERAEDLPAGRAELEQPQARAEPAVAAHPEEAVEGRVRAAAPRDRAGPVAARERQEPHDGPYRIIGRGWRRGRVVDAVVGHPGPHPSGRRRDDRVGRLGRVADEGGARGGREVVEVGASGGAREGCLDQVCSHVGLPKSGRNEVEDEGRCAIAGRRRRRSPLGVCPSIQDENPQPTTGYGLVKFRPN